jgi:hypothetical protein
MSARDEMLASLYTSTGMQALLVTIARKPDSVRPRAHVDGSEPGFAFASYWM